MLTFVDLETTGLEPRAGHILELGVIITDDFLVELDRRSWPILPTIGRHPELWQMNAYVTEMHYASGLIENVMIAGRPLGEVVADATEWIGDTHAGSMALMAGNSIHFDRSWIKLRMPRLDAAFGYRMVDVSSIKELVARWWPGREYKVEGDKPHRALPDIEHSIAELRYYATQFMGVTW
jgi:oligoribonuclease